jgi:hypothetical protein
VAYGIELERELARPGGLLDLLHTIFLGPDLVCTGVVVFLSPDLICAVDLCASATVELHVGAAVDLVPDIIRAVDLSASAIG